MMYMYNISDNNITANMLAIFAWYITPASLHIEIRSQTIHLVILDIHMRSKASRRDTRRARLKGITNHTHFRSCYDSATTCTLSCQ